MMGRKRPRYTAEFKAEAARLFRESGKSLKETARDIGVAATTLAAWTKQAEVDARRGPKGALTTEEREELIRLRRENRQVKQERDFLKKASAFFARESS
jgi:transposase